MGGFPVLGSWKADGGGGEVCCAPYKLALEGLVREAFELWNKDPVVMPLTLGHGGCVEAFPLELLGQQSQRYPCPLGTRLAHWEPGLCLCHLLARLEIP